MKKYALLIIFVAIMLLGIVACGNDDDTTRALISLQQATADIAPVQDDGNQQQDEINFTDINDLWAYYHQAVMNQDFGALKAIVNFPLRSYGMRYTDPVTYISESEFERAFTSFLAQEHYWIHISDDGEITDIVRTNYDFIVQNENLAFLGHDERGALRVNERQETGSLDGDWARAYDEIFEVVNGVWRLTAFFYAPRSNDAVDIGMTDAEIGALYNKAANAFGWFDMETMPLDTTYEEVDENGMVYWRVDFEGIYTLADLEVHLSSIFAPEIASELLAGGLYREFEGVLYAIGAGRGGMLDRGGETHEIIRESDQRIIYRVTVDVLDLETLEEVVDTVVYDFALNLVGEKWLFGNFNLTR